MPRRSYIVMARDECGEEFRPSIKVHTSMEKANASIPRLRIEYPECRGMWAEVFMDRAYFEAEHQDRYDEDTYDLY